jgi:hypothetical protein
MKKLLLFLLFLPSIVFGLDINYIFTSATGPYTAWTNSEAKPDKGGTYVEANSGLTGYRVTESTTEHNYAAGTGTEYCFNPQSSNGQWLVFAGAGPAAYYLYTTTTTPFTYIRNISALTGNMANGQQPEVRWDYSGSHPSWLYYRQGKCLNYLDVTDYSTHTVHDFTSDFPGYDASYYIMMGDEGDPSEDSRYWAWCWASSNLNIPFVFTYDKTLDVIISSMTTTTRVPNSMYVSKTGRYVFASTTYANTSSTDVWAGSWAFDIKMTTMTARKILSDSKHMCVAVDKQGNDVVVYAGTHGAVDGGDRSYGDAVQFTKMSNGYTYHLIDQGDLGWGPNAMWTAPGISKKGWAFYMDYTLPADLGDWSANQGFGFELDEARSSTTTITNRIWRLGSTQSLQPTAYYPYQTNPGITNDGQYLYWGADWRNSSAIMEVYRLNMPTNWYADLGGEGSPSVNYVNRCRGGITARGVTFK